MGNPRSFPTVAAYIAWARSEGCNVDRRSSGSAAAPYQTVRISTPEGRLAVEVFVVETDPLASTTIARLDRRLGLKSYLFT